MKDLTELRCSECKKLIGALGQMHDKKPYCYNCAHKLGYWAPARMVDNVVRIINGVLNDPGHRQNRTRPHRIDVGTVKTPK